MPGFPNHSAAAAPRRGFVARRASLVAIATASMCLVGASDASARTFHGKRTGERIRGTVKTDHIFAGLGNDKVIGLGGNDRLDGGFGRDKVAGGAGDDIITGDIGEDKLYGNAGTDEIDGGQAGDRMYGGDGDDILDGGDGLD
ncbi:MAG: hypothetical protein Q7T55_06400, partial [Solirubrobacteraceae bacterium]|nr:hypothetical protein [Solirubrobacteraceae bacterium]